MPQKVDSQKLSQLAGQPVEITVRDGETLEQAEARVMQENPEVFKSKPLEEEMTTPPKDAVLQNLLDAAGVAFEAGDTKELNRIEKAISIYKSVNPGDKAPTETAIKEKGKQSTVEDIKNALNIMKKIETYPGPVANIGGWIQDKGADWNMNPEVQQYRQKVDMLMAPVAKGIQGEVGNLSEFEQKAAKAYFPQDSMLYSKSGRDAALQNLFSSVKARTGRDLASEIPPEELKEIGYLQNLLATPKAPTTPTVPKKKGLTPEEQAELDELNRQLGQ